MTFFVRAAVLALTLTGSAAYVHITSSPVKSAVVTHNSCPRPMCPPSDPNGCGM